MSSFGAERDFLSADVDVLNSLLAKLPEDDYPGRLSLEARREEVLEKLALLGDVEEEDQANAPAPIGRFRLRLGIPKNATRWMWFWIVLTLFAPISWGLIYHRFLYKTGGTLKVVIGGVDLLVVFGLHALLLRLLSKSDRNGGD
jgi:hypothetical protein